MSKKSIKSHFRFNKQERNGIFFLLLIIVTLQLLSYFVKTYPHSSDTPVFGADTHYQSKIDRLKMEYSKRDSLKVYPFNPNYITDYKGYTLGLSPAEIDRLNIYRSKNKYVNSSKEFQEVTLISDSLLRILSPYFKFPDWVQGRKVKGGPRQGYVKTEAHETVAIESGVGAKALGYRDLNLATATELKTVYGVGEVLSIRIVKFRDRLGGFMVAEQLGHVYGLKQEVVDRILERFRIHEPPRIVKIDINEASAGEIAKLVYIDYEVALRIVAYREAKGRVDSFEELTGIPDFPSEKIDIIQLYLQL
ncbi:MAG TPA: helix-hairpin-helix domain-containing protein [Arenibacter sp.]|nr:helix-hairpin-helix domain-containing protein [Arenibacter sp.]